MADQEPDAPQDTPEPKEPAPEPKKNEPAPPWGSDDEFKPDKAWNLIQNLRKDIDDLRPKAQRAKELEDAQKSDLERLTEQATEAQQRAEQAERRALLAEARAERPNLTATQVERLKGDTVEELLADADEVYGTPEAPPEPAARPKERLRSGHAPNAEPEPDYEAIADRVRSW